MRNLPWSDFRRRCLKPDSDRIGTWTARRIARPLALRITWVVAPTKLSAHQATFVALVIAAVAAVVLSSLPSYAWLVGGLLLELWYVLDHVDGQLARDRGTASLDGTALDYWMHHAVNLVVPQAVAIGLVHRTGAGAWMWLGTAWSLSLVTISLRHDVRYKSFVQRLKILSGELRVVGGGGGRRTAAAWPTSPRTWIAWAIKKSCEMHVLAHGFTVVGFICCVLPSLALRLQIATMAVLASSAALVAVVYVRRGLLRGEAEAEFAAWYHVPVDATLEFRDGTWIVETPAAPSRNDTPTPVAADAARTS